MEFESRETRRNVPARASVACGYRHVFATRRPRAFARSHAALLQSQNIGRSRARYALMTQIFRFCLVRIFDWAIPSLFEIRNGPRISKNPKLCFHNGPVGTGASRGYAAVLLSPILPDPGDRFFAYGRITAKSLARLPGCIPCNLWSKIRRLTTECTECTE